MKASRLISMITEGGTIEPTQDEMDLINDLLVSEVMGGSAVSEEWEDSYIRTWQV